MFNLVISKREEESVPGLSIIAPYMATSVQHSALIFRYTFMFPFADCQLINAFYLFLGTPVWSICKAVEITFAGSQGLQLQQMDMLNTPIVVASASLL